MPQKKLWQKNDSNDALVERFTIGRDRQLDLYLARFDVLGSLAHIRMLHKIGLLDQEELSILNSGLIEIYEQITCGNFEIEEGVEDVHSQVELLLTRRLGTVGKKIHSGRSRNDQVLVDLRLFFRDYVESLAGLVLQLFDQLLDLSEKHKSVLLPGYTHTQVAMPSSFGLWFAAWAESLVDDTLQLEAAYKIINKNPLGSAAGYGSSFPLDRELTTRLLGFENLNYNVVYAQMGRGRTERVLSQSLASLAETLGKLADDIITYMTANFAFISFPDALTTGSSIMPHKKNPDLFEVLRARCNQLKALPNEILMLTTNLGSGYHRDFQLVKETLIPAMFALRDSVKILIHALPKIEVHNRIGEQDIYNNLFTVEAVNKLVMQGIPFRDAYRTIAEQVETGQFKVPDKVEHTHCGSIGNLCNDKIRQMMAEAMDKMIKKESQSALKNLLNPL